MRLATRVSSSGPLGWTVEVVVAKGFEGCVVFADEGVASAKMPCLKAFRRVMDLPSGYGSGGFECVERLASICCRCHVSPRLRGMPYDELAGAIGTILKSCRL